eukprot:764549-Hanusia_phi.AAC.6
MEESSHDWWGAMTPQLRSLSILLFLEESTFIMLARLPCAETRSSIQQCRDTQQARSKQGQCAICLEQIPG